MFCSLHRMPRCMFTMPAMRRQCLQEPDPLALRYKAQASVQNARDCKASGASLGLKGLREQVLSMST